MLKKNTKIFLIICVLTLVGITIYGWLTREEWPTRKKCTECELAESGKTQRLIGTIKAQPDNKMLFTEPETGKTYHLILCDAKCNNNLNKWFKQMGFVDFATKEPIYFDIEGKLDTIKQEFLLASVVLLGEEKTIVKNRYIQPKKIKNQTLKELKEKYHAISEETFPLNEASVSEFRLPLHNHFNETGRKQPTPIKEVTWEINDTTFLTIWFIQKQNKWTPFEQYQWKKGTVF